MNHIEDLGMQKWNEALSQLRDQRNKLGEKIGKSPKKGKRNKKSALKSKSILNETDDAISAFTGYTTELDALIKDQDRITDDFFPH